MASVGHIRVSVGHIWVSVRHTRVRFRHIVALRGQELEVEDLGKVELHTLPHLRGRLRT